MKERVLPIPSCVRVTDKGRLYIAWIELRLSLIIFPDNTMVSGGMGEAEDFTLAEFLERFP
jgi:hypothetical protein